MKKILIVGAGISGLYLASLLEKDGRYNYKIYEKKPEIDFSEGYGIQLSVNGIRLLNQVGFKKIPVQDIFYPRKINFFDAKNLELISNIEISRFNQDENYYSTMKRCVLQKFLLCNIPKEKIRFNSNIVSIDEKDKVKINFDDNFSEEGDFLIICDGVFSKTKNMVIGKNEEIKFYNSVALRGNLLNTDDKDISLYLGPNFHFVTYPINQKREYNFISVIKEKNLKKIQSSNQEKLIQYFIDKIQHHSSYNLNNNLENKSIYPIFVSNRLRIPENKNVYLAGDALFAFPPSFAQGASQSIESAYEVYKNIEGKRENYFHSRKIKIRQVNSRSTLNHFAFHASNPMITFARNLSLKYLVNKNIFLENYLGKIYR